MDTGPRVTVIPTNTRYGLDYSSLGESILGGNTLTIVLLGISETGFLDTSVGVTVFVNVYY